jgi:hypothetical protein
MQILSPLLDEDGVSVMADADVRDLLAAQNTLLQELLYEQRALRSAFEAWTGQTGLERKDPS